MGAVCELEGGRQCGMLRNLRGIIPYLLTSTLSARGK